MASTQPLTMIVGANSSIGEVQDPAQPDALYPAAMGSADFGLNRITNRPRAIERQTCRFCGHLKDHRIRFGDAGALRDHPTIEIIGQAGLLDLAFLLSDGPVRDDHSCPTRRASPIKCLQHSRIGVHMIDHPQKEILVNGGCSNLVPNQTGQRSSARILPDLQARPGRNESAIRSRSAAHHDDSSMSWPIHGTLRPGQGPRCQGREAGAARVHHGPGLLVLESSVD